MNEILISKDRFENYLLVEGSDDDNVCYHLLKNYNIEHLVKIIDKNGIENLLQTLPVELLRSGQRRLGIVVDADENLESRWFSIQSILINFGYHTIPKIPNPNGTIIDESELPRVGI